VRSRQGKHLPSQARLGGGKRKKKHIKGGWGTKRYAYPIFEHSIGGGGKGEGARKRRGCKTHWDRKREKKKQKMTGTSSRKTRVIGRATQDQRKPKKTPESSAGREASDISLKKSKKRIIVERLVTTNEEKGVIGCRSKHSMRQMKRRTLDRERR